MSSKKVLLINGSARKKNTYNMLTQIEQILKNRGVETEIFNLFDYEIKDCVGCEVCVTQECCRIRDDMPVIMEKILNSDGVVFGTPVYMCGVTSKLKTFIDRTNIWIHKPSTVGKPVMFAMTTTVTGLKDTSKFLNTYATGIGVRIGNSITRTNKNINLSVTEEEISKFLTLLAQNENEYKPTMNEIVLFNVGKVLALKSNGDDRRFWEAKKWIDKKYYYPCKINPGKKLFSSFMFKVLTKAMK